METKEKNRGITLIALVITIIILLILTGVTVIQLLNRGGLLNRITEIGENSKEKIENSDNQMGKSIEDNLDTKTGAIHIQDNDCSLEVVGLRYKYIEVELKLNNYELFLDGESYEIDNIGYQIKKVDGNGSYESYEHGSEKYNCSFTGLSEGTYEIVAFAEHGSNIKEPIDIVTATITSVPYQIGDWVDYDAGVWTKGEISSLGTLYSDKWKEVEGNFTDKDGFASSGKSAEIKGTYLTNQFSGMYENYNKNCSQAYTVTGASGSLLNLDNNPPSKGHENVKDAVNKGWRILDITDEGKIVIVSAGIPEYYIARAQYVSLVNPDHNVNEYTVKYYYVEGTTLKGINNRTFSEYINSTYAEDARMMTYEDVKKAEKGPTNLANIGATYVQATVNKGSYYSVSEALDKGIYGESSKNSWLTFYNTSFSDGPYYSAGLLGVRVVITLKPDTIPTNIDENGNATLQGTYSSPLRLANKSELGY